MKRLLVVSPILISFLVLGGIGSWEWYNHSYLSGDLRRTLVAAVDPQDSNNDVLIYLRIARLQVKTQRDQTLFDKLKKMVFLSQEADKLNKEWWDNSLDTNTDYACRELEYAYYASESEKARLRKICINEIDEDKLISELNKTLLSKQEVDEKQIKQIYTELRSDLDLEPVN